ncbi:hypothetical protein PQR11_04260 [Paraburkholderia strydomiana]|uniref:hypothetical protein n=1 Tax=Paraburkholderia strydomiana TaxID=1245417 RepID=UPI0038B8A1A6
MADQPTDSALPSHTRRPTWEFSGDNACYRGNDLRWLSRAPDVPKKWFLKRRLDEDSFAYDVLQHGKDKQGKQPVELWFDNDGADDYEVMEHCARGRDGEVLVLIYLNEDMMTPRSSYRRDGDDEMGRGGYARGRW